MDPHVLLAMRHAAGGSAALARALLDDPQVARDPRWRAAPADRVAAAQQLAAIRALGIGILPVWSLPAPFRLARPPPVLFVRGNALLVHARALGIVGSRQASGEACSWAAARAREAGALGAIVASGGARGIDGAAHAAAVDAGIPTVAWLGVAIDRVFPAVHRALFARILAAGGALVSEHPPGAATHSYHHAERNRFIAAHSLQLFIAEADADSGALGTAEHARRLGVPIWVSAPGVGWRRAGLESLVARGAAQVWRGG